MRHKPVPAAVLPAVVDLAHQRPELGDVGVLGALVAGVIA